jgi:hypothetical protein
MDKKLQKVKFEGELKLGNGKIRCYVLKDGTRVLSKSSGEKILKLLDKGNSNELFGSITDYEGTNGTLVDAFKATKLIDFISDVYFDRQNRFDKVLVIT